MLWFLSESSSRFVSSDEAVIDELGPAACDMMCRLARPNDSLRDTTNIIG